MKTFASPPAAIEMVFFAVCNLLAGITPIVPVDKNKKLKAPNVWKVSQALMKSPAEFVGLLDGFKQKIDDGEVYATGFKAIRDTLNNEDFNPEIIKVKSSAAAGVCDWVLNIVMYYDVVVTVEPKR